MCPVGMFKQQFSILLGLGRRVDSLSQKTLCHCVRIRVIFYPHSFVFLRKFDYTGSNTRKKGEGNGQIKPVALLFISSSKKPRTVQQRIMAQACNLESCLQGIIFSRRGDCYLTRSDQTLGVVIFRLLQIMLHCFTYLLKCSRWSDSKDDDFWSVLVVIIY